MLLLLLLLLQCCFAAPSSVEISEWASALSTSLIALSNDVMCHAQFEVLMMLLSFSFFFLTVLFPLVLGATNRSDK